jgi:hypothetical protein
MMTFHHHIRILTEVSYPEGPTYAKWDYFSISDEELPQHFRELPDPEEFYDFLNNSGFWVKGWQEITEEIDAWIDSHPDQCGLQDEIAIEVAFI